ncbi:MAG: lytic transglycosylase domain-containing protein [Bacteroidales bacterium]|nr:lytic transglycosylase domain-containing protein [Bacteroidales bacterium]
MKIYKVLIPVILIVSVSLIYIAFDSSDNVLDNAYNEHYQKDYRIYNPPIPEKMDFAGEELPLDVFYVAESFEREILVNTFWHSNSLLVFKRANRWFPIIEPILKENNIPDDFKYLAVIESGLTNATSPAGAKGFWQFMKTTAIQYGLEVNGQVDERLHVEKATKAACRYLKDAHKKYGSWVSVAASYNMGMGGLSNQMSRQGENSYFDLSLNSETARYVYRIAALKAIFTAPKNYGFYLKPSDLYPKLSCDLVTLDSSVNDFAVYAKNLNISYRMLKELNPWILTTQLTNSNAKEYQVKIPTKELNNYSKLKSEMSDEIGIFGDEKGE